MKRRDFMNRFAKEAGISQRKGKQLCISLFKTLKDCIEEEGRVVIDGFGTFKKVMKSEHRVGNFYGDEPIVIPAKEKIVFEPSVKRATKTVDADEETEQ